MNYQVRYTLTAKEDLKCLFTFLAERDRQAAVQARKTIAECLKILEKFPFTCRKVDDEWKNPFLRELLITFGGAGYVALFEIADNETVTIIAVRHQREDDYH